MALTTNLISFWELTEASGTRADSHGSNPLTPTNAPGNGSAGTAGTGVDLERSSAQYLSHADNTDLSTGDTDWTMQFWIHLESYFGDIIAHKGWDSTGADREFILYLPSDEPRFVFQSPGGAGGQLVWAVGLALGTPYCVHIWHDAANDLVGLVLNAGTPVTSAYTTGISDTAHDFVIGARTSTGEYFDGVITKAAMWRRVLTGAERTALYNGGAGMSYADMVAASGGGASAFNALLMMP